MNAGILGSDGQRLPKLALSVGLASRRSQRPPKIAMGLCVVRIEPKRDFRNNAKFVGNGIDHFKLRQRLDVEREDSALIVLERCHDFARSFSNA